MKHAVALPTGESNGWVRFRRAAAPEEMPAHEWPRLARSPLWNGG